MTRSATDRDGRCKIEFPRVLPKEIYITARKAGYANRGYGPLLEPGGAAIPGDHTIEMERGVTIGGTVKTRDGKAVGGATVIIMARAGADSSPDWSYVPEVKVTTDTEGRWRFNEMPTGWSFVYIRVTHPDYVPTFMQRDVPKPSDFLLKAKKAEMILDEGVALAGRVVDDQGRPLAGAKIGLGADRRIRHSGFPSVSTDAEGRFRFGHVPSGTQTVTAQSPGRAPELADVVVASGMKPVEFRLGPGHLIRGRVVNPEGKPLDGVTVQAMNWKGHSSLDWTTKTDAEGRFTWDSAPAEPVLLTLTRPGYTMVGQREFQADKGETNVTMYPPLRVRGKVTDASDGATDRAVHGGAWRLLSTSPTGTERLATSTGSAVGHGQTSPAGSTRSSTRTLSSRPWPCGSRPRVTSRRRRSPSRWRPGMSRSMPGSSPGSAHPGWYTDPTVGRSRARR